MFSGFESISPPKGKPHKKLGGNIVTMFSEFELISPPKDTQYSLLYSVFCIVYSTA